MHSGREIERLTAENLQLQQQLDELNLVLNSHSIVVVTDPNGVIIDMNDRFCEISQYRREELIGRTHQVLNSGHHSPEFFAALWSTIASGEVWRGEIRNRAKDGTEHWVDTTIVPLLDEHGAPRRYVAIRSEGTQRRLAEQLVRRLAYVDEQTGLPNRAALTRVVDERLGGHVQGRSAASTDDEPTRYSAFVTIGVDGYGAINDAFGHAVASLLVQRVATALQSLPMRLDPLGRVGTDVFGMLLDGGWVSQDDARTACTELAAQIGEALRTSLPLDGGLAIRVITSCGFVVIDTDCATSTESIIASAEIARKQVVHEAAHLRVREFEPRMLQDAQERIALILALRQGFTDGELALHVQPVVNRMREVVAYEALLRWESPTRGTVLPDDFIGLAEQTGMIIDIGNWVLDEACRTLAQWAENAATRDLRLSVNVSARQLEHEGFMHSVLAPLAENGVGAERLLLELTEGVLHVDADRTRDILRSLNDAGVRSSLDDFGTGYSSLSYLRGLPVRQVKIDRSFVRRIGDTPGDLEVVKMIVSLAQALELEVVAEGVELESQFDALAELGVDRFQGWLFGHPVPVAEVPAASAERTPGPREA